VTRARALALTLTIVAGVPAMATNVVASAAAKSADGPPSWRVITATLESGVDPTSDNPCNRGERVCVDAVVHEMRRRERLLAARCDHNAVFAVVYRVVTAQVGRGWPRDFTSPEWIANFDAVFGEFYFDSYDRWTRREVVPAAWSIALDAGRDRTVSGLGDVLLGLNAHISRDLPFVLAEVGLTTVEGTSAHDDFERANDLLVDLLDDTLASVSTRFDPSVAVFEVPGIAADEEAFRALITTWRAEAWTRAQQLVAAPTPEARQVAAEQIEAIAASRALAITAATAYVPFVSSTAARDRFCRARR
jgi:hypothetical protein